MIVAQNLVLNIGDWTELHGICVLKTAPKVSKRKTMLMYTIVYIGHSMGEGRVTHN